MLITKKIEIDIGHRVPNHKSKCRNLHGHRYVIEVGIDDKIINKTGVSDEGMVIDFNDLKEIMMREIDDKFDHGFVMYEKDVFAPMFNWLTTGKEFPIVQQEPNFITGPYKPQKIIFVDFIPTAENLAKHWYELIKPRLQERSIKLAHVKVWETPNSTAIYNE